MSFKDADPKFSTHFALLDFPVAVVQQQTDKSYVQSVNLTGQLGNME